MKKNILAGMAVLGAVALVATGCAGAGNTSGDGGDGGDDGPVSVGFAQTGSESGWRSANTESMKTATGGRDCRDPAPRYANVTAHNLRRCGM